MQSKSATHNPTPVGVRSENASLGSSGFGATRSSRNITTSAMTAPQISAALSSGDTTIDAEDVAAMARQIRATRPTGTPDAGVRRTEVADGRMKKAPTARTPAVTAVATKALRQLPKRANMPPTNGPISTDMLQLVDINAMVRDQTASGKVARTAT